jgi:uracil-DNA glycosylase
MTTYKSVTSLADIEDKYIFLVCDCVSPRETLLLGALADEYPHLGFYRSRKEPSTQGTSVVRKLNNKFYIAAFICYYPLESEDDFSKREMFFRVTLMEAIRKYQKLTLYYVIPRGPHSLKLDELAKVLAEEQKATITIIAKHEVNTPTLVKVEAGSLLEVAQTFFVAKKCKGWHPFYIEVEPALAKISQAIHDDMHRVVPPPDRIFRVFSLLPHKIRVVLVGQDPYPQPGRAVGLCFSFPVGKPPEDSLANIFKELCNDGFTANDDDGDLSPWFERGVFLINTALTTLQSTSGAHVTLWAEFTKRLFIFLNNLPQRLVFIMWGGKAQAYRKNLNEDKHMILTAAHPSPMNGGVNFFGSKPFSKCNQALVGFGYEPINWNLE